jgi:hypothetical protein
VNLGSHGNGPNILAHLEFPTRAAGRHLQPDGPPVLYPGGAQATRVWTARDWTKSLELFAFFDKESLSGQVTNGPVILTVAGQLSNGQWYFGKDTVRIIGTGRNR